MRKITKTAQLDSFSNFVRKETPNTWEELHEKGKEVYFETRSYILIYEQDCLCGYTELQINDETDSHIDHYKKRSMFPRDTFNWQNLIVSTNNEKFGAKYKDNNSGIRQADYALIIDPVAIDAQNYFYYNNFGQIEPKPNLDDISKYKAIKTIEIFNLRHESLRKKREQRIKEIRDCINALPKETLHEIFKGKSFPSIIEQYLS